MSGELRFGDGVVKLTGRDALVATRQQLELGRRVVCSVCGRAIDLDRVAALPTTSRCVDCAA